VADTTPTDGQSKQMTGPLSWACHLLSGMGTTTLDVDHIRCCLLSIVPYFALTLLVSVDPILFGLDCQIQAKTGIWQSPWNEIWIY